MREVLVRAAAPAVACVLVAASGASAQSCSDYGVPVNGYPNWQERATMVLTNAVRISPMAYRDTYLAGIAGASTILQPTAYPAVPPLQWVQALNLSARAHSLEMATTAGCTFAHNSCDGTSFASRVGGYYPNYRSIGENIAAGYSDPLTTVNAWLLDSSGGVPAADGASGDGHRRNIMSSGFTQFGCGYASGSNTYRYYWTQDFGRPATTPAPCSPIATGSHILPTGSTVFLANYYDANNAAPQSASVVINGVASPMTVQLGSAARGTYRYSTSRATACRGYHFEFRDSAGVLQRYPAHGELRTYGEGTCTEDFTDAAPQPPPPCRADFNASGGVSVQDIFDFLGAYFANSARADFNTSGSVSVQDVFDYLSAYFRGC